LLFYRVVLLVDQEFLEKTMRGFLLLAALALTNAHDNTKCALNGARAVDDMLDSAVYIMASIVRCDKSNGAAADSIRCSLDVSSAIESVNGMVNVILKAVDKCGKLKTDNHKCGLAIGVLTEGYAGLAAASSGIIAKCPNKLNNFHSLETVGQAMTNAADSAGHANNWGHGNTIATLPGNAASPGNSNFVNLQGGASLGQCIVNVKNTMKSLFKAIARIMTIKHNCKDPESKHCSHNSLKIMAGFIGMGEFLSGAIGKCTPYTAENLPTKERAICAQYSLKLVHQLGVVDRASLQMSKDCELTHDQRLYLDGAVLEQDAQKTSSSVTLGLAALIPVSAVLAFVAGTRFAKTRTQVPQNDCEALMPVSE
jgi:hypothetical protein